MKRGRSNKPRRQRGRKEMAGRTKSDLQEERRQAGHCPQQAEPLPTVDELTRVHPFSCYKGLMQLLVSERWEKERKHKIRGTQRKQAIWYPWSRCENKNTSRKEWEHRWQRTRTKGKEKETGGNEGERNRIIRLVRMLKSHNCQRSSTTRIMNQISDESFHIAMTFRRVNSTQFCSAFSMMSMRLERKEEKRKRKSENRRKTWMRNEIKRKPVEVTRNDQETALGNSELAPWRHLFSFCTWAACVQSVPHAVAYLFRQTEKPREKTRKRRKKNGRE